MTKCNQSPGLFPSCKSRKIHAAFDGGAVSSDGGALLLRAADRKLRLTEALQAALHDPRRQASCDHSQQVLLRQRIYGLALGYEDLNDHATLREDVALQTAADTDQTLASTATLCRWENRADRQTAWAMASILVDQFIRSHRRAPAELILDFVGLLAADETASGSPTERNTQLSKKRQKGMNPRREQREKKRQKWFVMTTSFSGSWPPRGQASFVPLPMTTNIAMTWSAGRFTSFPAASKSNPSMGQES